MPTCPECGEEVTYAALLNLRNGRWTVLPIDLADDPGEVADVILTGKAHEAVDILGATVGTFPVAEVVPVDGTATHRKHPPSHYLGAH